MPKRLFGRNLRAGVLCLLATALPLASAQDQVANASNSGSDVPKFSSEVKVVSVLATVRDKHGKIINDLSKDDFQLDEDGRSQSIKYFTRETDLPLKLGLLVDTSGSVMQVLPEERTASQNFLDQVLREDKDSAFLIHFDRQVELLQDFTSSKAKLQSSMGDIQPSNNDSGASNSGGGNNGGGNNGGGNGPYGRGGGGGPYGRGGGGHRHGGGTLLYDAIYLASDELMQKQTGRKALILLTDGEDNGSKTSLLSAIETAQRSNTLVYAIHFKGEEFHGFNQGGGGRGGWGRGGMGGGGMGRGGPSGYPQEQRPDGKKVLEQITKETGGRMFEVSKKETVDKIYGEIQEELRNQYNIGYTPNREAADSGSFHKIHLAAKQKDFVVQARDGYYD